MESAGPSTKKMRLPPAAMPVVNPAPGIAGRSDEPPPPGSKELVESSVDRISDLPGVILEEIISLLPTKDCCRTQVLSTRWHPLWRTAPLNLDCCQIYVLPEFDLIRAIVSSHQQGPIQCLCIPTSYLLSIPDKVDAWLTSPEFGKLQQFEFYHYHKSFIPRTYQKFVPTPPLSISQFSSSLHTATFARCHLHTIWYKCFDSHF